MRTAAVVIDNFLSEDKWEYICNEVLSSSYLKTDTFGEWKDLLYEKIIEWIQEKAKEIDVWQDHWEHTIPMWSYMNTLPSGVDRESAGGGYHQDFGGFVYYAHPSWNSDWDGHLKFKDCDVEKIVPVPNRFVWINPGAWHGIEVVNEKAEHNRITVVGWPEGCVETSYATQTINIIKEEKMN
jgi:hypothetical protein